MTTSNLRAAALLAACLAVCAGVAAADHEDLCDTCETDSCEAELVSHPHYDEAECENLLSPNEGGGRRLANAEYNTIPAGGWSNFATTHNGLEWLYAAPVPARPDYYAECPQHSGRNTCGNLNDRYTFPPCIRGSGWRLPTPAEFALRPATAPACGTKYAMQGYRHCDIGDYNGGRITLTTGAGFCDETVYVRAIGSEDSCSAPANCDGVPAFDCTDKRFIPALGIWVRPCNPAEDGDCSIGQPGVHSLQGGAYVATGENLDDHDQCEM